VLAAVLDGLCRLLHPVVPFLTEQVWQDLAQAAPHRGLPEPEAAAESVCIAAWPSYPTAWHDPEAEAEMVYWQEAITAVRNLRAEHHVPKDARIRPTIVAAEAVASILRRGEAFLLSLTGAAAVRIEAAAERPAQGAVTVLPWAEVHLPLAGVIDTQAEEARNRKALADLDRQLTAVQAKLRNESFLSRAPADVVEQQRAKESELAAQRAAVAALLAGS
jgi:valyl-tRNA synthetase